jgi:hypothetical protein
MTWANRGIIAFPASVSNAIMDEVAAMISSVAALETPQNERRMFDNAPRLSSDYVNVTHSMIAMPLTDALRNAFVALLNTHAAQLPGLLWYVEDLAGTLIDTNDPARKSGSTITGKPLRWQPGLNVVAGEIYWHQIRIVEVVQSHTTQVDWEPQNVPALFKEWYDPENPRKWKQPLGAHDAYRLGQRVLWNGELYRSTIDNNVWSPDVTGWALVNAPESPATPEWAYPVAYKVNDEVTYQGQLYRCRQAHTSQAGWTPPAVLSLWLPI